MPVLGGSVGQDLSNGTGSLAANTSIKIIQVKLSGRLLYTYL